MLSLRLRRHLPIALPSLPPACRRAAFTAGQALLVGCLTVRLPSCLLTTAYGLAALGTAAVAARAHHLLRDGFAAAATAAAARAAARQRRQLHHQQLLRELAAGGEGGGVGGTGSTGGGGLASAVGGSSGVAIPGAAVALPSGVEEGALAAAEDLAGAEETGHDMGVGEAVLCAAGGVLMGWGAIALAGIILAAAATHGSGSSATAANDVIIAASGVGGGGAGGGRGGSVHCAAAVPAAAVVAMAFCAFAVADVFALVGGYHAYGVRLQPLEPPPQPYTVHTAPHTSAYTAQHPHAARVPGADPFAVGGWRGGVGAGGGGGGGRSGRWAEAAYAALGVYLDPLCLALYGLHHLQVRLMHRRSRSRARSAAEAGAEVAEAEGSRAGPGANSGPAAGAGAAAGAAPMKRQGV